jgi:stearoyl-CoA desaturase (delta-9 desaturase)
MMWTRAHGPVADRRIHPRDNQGHCVHDSSTLAASPALEITLADMHDGDHAPEETEELRPVSRAEKIASLAAVVLPFVGLVAALVLLWGVTHSWIHLVLLAVGYVLTGLGITVGYHRLFTHKSFETNAVVRAALGILGSMAIEGSVLRWVATHRRHHQHSDGDHDPHSPHHHGGGVRGVLRGFWHAHVGWFFTPEPMGMIEKYVPDLQRDPVTRVVSRLFGVWVLLGLLVPGLIAWAVTGTWVGGLLGVLWGGAARIFLVHHITWSVNSVCHLWGRRPFRSHDLSRNNAVMGVLAFGEGWHNNHHAFPASARHGLRWWQLDVSYLVIKALEAVGMARNVRVPTPDRIDAKLVR